MAKGNTTQRGYGRRHQQIRRTLLLALADRVAAGITDLCPRCQHPIHPNQPLDLDHTDDRSGYRGLAHRTCNRRAGAEKTNRMRRARPVTSRQW